MSRVAASLVLSIAACVQAADTTVPVPDLVQLDLESVSAECAAADGIPRTADAVKRIDLNGDGREDYVLDVGTIVCVGAASVYGDRAKAVRVYASAEGQSVRQVFEDWVFGAALRDGALWLTVSGAQCGKPPAPDFASESFCERPLVWNAKRDKMEYAPLSTVRMVE